MLIIRSAKALLLGLALASTAWPALAQSEAGPPRRLRSTTFTLSPGESLKPQPRPRVETGPLDPPAPAVAPVVVTPDRLFGRWTQVDLGYCEHDQYVLEWAADRQRIVLDGRAIETRKVRYSADAGSLKVETLRDGVDPVGYWRLVPIDDDHVKWTENAELRRDRAGLELVAKPDKLLLRCPPVAAPPPGLFGRVKRLWTGMVDRLLPRADEGAPSSGAAEQPHS